MANREIIKDRSLAPSEIIFGDGPRAIIIKRKEFECPKRKCTCVRFALKPTRKLAQMHNISDDSFRDGFIIKVYKKHFVVDNLSQDPSTLNATMILCDWNGEPTKVSKLHSALLSELDSKNKEIWFLKSQVFKLECEKEEIKLRPRGHWGDSIKDLSAAKVLLSKSVPVDKDGKPVEVSGL